jgi:hypothetical protein
MAYVIQLAGGAFLSSLSWKYHTRSWEAHERDQQFRGNEGIDNGKSQRLWKEGNARIHNLSAREPDLAMIIEKVRTSRYFESPETDLQLTENACWIDYPNRWSSERVHWLSIRECPHCSTTDHGCENMMEFDIGVARAGLLITGIDTHMASKSKTQWIPASVHNSGRKDHCKVCDGCVDAIPILDPVDVKEAYSHIASRYRV